jgi:hypothetical protein
MRASALKKNDYLRIALYVVLTAVVLGFLLNTYRKGMNDFRVVHRAATRVIHQDNLYNFDDQHYLYKYSPSFAFLVAPIGLLPFSAAKVIWILGMCICLLLIMRWSKRMIMGDRSPPAYLYLLTLLFTSKFWVREMWLGQTDLLMLVFIFLFISCTDRGKDFWAGLFLAMAVIIKPTPLIFMPYLLFKRRFKPVVSLVMASMVLVLLPSIVYGISGNISLLSGWKTVMSVSSPPLLASDVNQSFFGFFYRFLTATSFEVNVLNLNYTVVNVLIYASALGLFLFLLFLNRRSELVKNSLVKNRECIEYSLLLIFMTLFSPLGWFQNYCSSILAYMLLIYYVMRTRFRDRFVSLLLLTSFVLVDLINFELVGRRINDLSLYLSFIVFGIFLVIACLSRLRLSRIA